MEPVVHLRGTVALLGRFPALAGIDLDVLRGEIVLLRGPNGAGKTTVLRVLAGLVPPVRGEARVLGHTLPAEARAVRRRVGLLGHATALFEELTAADNVGFWGRACRASKHDIEAALGLVGLDGRLRDVAVSRLSAGQRRRTSLACLLARRPELWLLDEPHAGLDNDARDLLDGLVRQAVSQGATVVMSSHELDRAQALAHREVALAGGITTGPAPSGGERPGEASSAAAPGAAEVSGAAPGAGGPKSMVEVPAGDGSAGAASSAAAPGAGGVSGAAPGAGVRENRVEVPAGDGSAGAASSAATPGAGGPKSLVEVPAGDGSAGAASSAAAPGASGPESMVEVRAGDGSAGEASSAAAPGAGGVSGAVPGAGGPESMVEVPAGDGSAGGVSPAGGETSGAGGPESMAEVPYVA